jgi:hypothetical protein
VEQGTRANMTTRLTRVFLAWPPSDDNSGVHPVNPLR